MWFLIISVGLIFISEFWIKSRKPEIAKDDKKMRFIRVILLTITSPFLTIGMLSLRGDNRSLAKVNLRASNSPFQQLNSFLDQSVSVYFYSVLLISENV